MDIHLTVYELVSDVYKRKINTINKLNLELKKYLEQLTLTAKLNPIILQICQQSAILFL